MAVKPVSHPLIQAALEKYKTEPMKKGRPDWTLNSRNLIIACLFGPMKQKLPRGAKDKMPSIAAPVLEKMDTPLAGLIIKYRSKAHSLTSIRNALEQVRTEKDFDPGSETPDAARARVIFNVVNFGNVERIFTRAEDSIPISADKRVRYAMRRTHDEMVNAITVPDRAKHMLPIGEVVAEGEISL